MSSGFSSIGQTEFKQRLDEGGHPYVLDVRGAHEAEIARLDFADRLQPHGDVLAIADELPRDRDILIHCRSGGRSAMACSMLAANGFSRLFNLEGGINGWAAEVVGITLLIVHGHDCGFSLDGGDEEFLVHRCRGRIGEHDKVVPFAPL